MAKREVAVGDFRQRATELVRHVEDRSGHDRRYSLDSGKSRDELGWEPQVPFTEGFARTVAWYRDHLDWLDTAHDVPVVTAPLGVPSPASD